MAQKGILLVEPTPLGQFSNKTNINAYKPAFNVDSKAAKDIDKITNEQASATIEQAIEGIQNVSRPVFGVMAKPNTHAYVQVIGPQGNTIQCFNNVGIPGNPGSFGYYTANNFKAPKEEGWGAGALESLKSTGKAIADAFRKDEYKTRKFLPEEGATPMSPVWTDWILQSVQESRIEKTQVVETFGDSYFYAFGQKPRSIAFSGLLMNTLDHNWRSIFWKNWDEYFRATKLVERGARVYIQWDEIIVEGYPINAVCSEVADSPNAMKFSFTLFVTRYVNIAAQSGFLTQQYMRLAQLRAGSGIGMISKEQGYRLLGGEAFPGEANKFEKFSLIGQLGPTLGNTAKQLFLGTEFGSELQQSATGRALTRQIGYLATYLQKEAYLLGSNPRYNDDTASLMRNSYLQQLNRDISTSLATDAANFVEDTLQVRRGEVNRLLVGVQQFMDLTKDNTREGAKFQLSPYAKNSSVQRLAESIFMPGLWTSDETEGFRVARAGGAILVDDGGTPIREVIDDFSTAERASIADSQDFSVREREVVEDSLDI